METLKIIEKDDCKSHKNDAPEDENDAGPSSDDIMKDNTVSTTGLKRLIPIQVPSAAAKSCWGMKSAPGDIPSLPSFKDVMDEQQLHESSPPKLGSSLEHSSLEFCGGVPDDLVAAAGVWVSDAVPPSAMPDTTNDELLAQLLQYDFDEEFAMIQSKPTQDQASPPDHPSVELNFDVFRKSSSGEKASNKSSKGRGDEASADGETDSDDDDDQNRDWDTFASDEREKKKTGVTLNRQGFAKKGNKVTVTKHDAVVCGRRNACRIMEFKSDIETGDGGGFDMKLSNNVYNALKVHSMAEAKRAARLHEKKEKSTAESVMDENSRLMIFKLINAGILDEVNGAISTGKEANVYHGVGCNPDKQITSGEVALKVYKTTLNEFKNRDPYIKDDFRFRDKFSKSNNRKLIMMWAEKEMHNLNRIKRAGIPCPEVVILKKHILVMTFIGFNGKSAPTLKEAILTQDQMKKAYFDTVDIMKRLYVKCDLIHADLSEFNLLWHEDKVWVIDVSQSVMNVHPHSLVFLLRDCYNITNFFGKRGVIEAKTPAELFTEVCGKILPDGKMDGIELLSKVEEYERNMEYLAHGMSRTGDPFDEMFAKSLSDKENMAKEFFKDSYYGSTSPPKHQTPIPSGARMAKTCREESMSCKPSSPPKHQGGQHQQHHSSSGSDLKMSKSPPKHGRK